MAQVMLLLQYTLIFASVLILGALGGCFSEHSGVIISMSVLLIVAAFALIAEVLPSGSRNIERRI